MAPYRVHAEDCLPPLQGETVSGERYPLDPPPRYWLGACVPGAATRFHADSSRTSLVWMSSRRDPGWKLHFLCGSIFVPERKRHLTENNDQGSYNWPVRSALTREIHDRIVDPEQCASPGRPGRALQKHVKWGRYPRCAPCLAQKTGPTSSKGHDTEHYRGEVRHAPDRGRSATFLKLTRWFKSIRGYQCLDLPTSVTCPEMKTLGAGSNVSTCRT